MNKLKLVMIGNGMAGVRTLEELLKLTPDLYDITVFGAEPHPNYNRILLSPVLAGEQTMDEIVLNPFDWYRDNGITLHAGWKVTEVDRVKRVVTAENATGERRTAPYDRLLLATGSNPFMLPIPGRELDGVLAYRDMADTQAMIDAAQKYKHAVVIGGGLLGLEAANGLMKRGMSVTVVHVAEWLMERQLDRVAGGMLQRSLQERGMQFRLGAQTQELLGDASGRVNAVLFKDGTHVPAELVVMAVGIRPEAGLAREAGLDVQRGIVVDDAMRTADPAIYAIGECAEHQGICCGLVAPAFAQAETCARVIAGANIAYVAEAEATALKVAGAGVWSAGRIDAADAEEIVLSDAEAGEYRKLLLREDRLVGAVLYGETLDAPWYQALIASGRPVQDLRAALAFGPAFIPVGN